MNPREAPPNAGGGAPGTEHSTITILEGMQLRREPPAPDRFSFDKLIETNILLLGGIGSGKTNAMKHLVRQFRDKNGPDDVFVFFDAKGDFLKHFYRPGDATISSAPTVDPGGAVWNVFRDLAEDPRQRAEEAFEVASTIFSDELGSGQARTCSSPRRPETSSPACWSLWRRISRQSRLGPTRSSGKNLKARSKSGAISSKTASTLAGTAAIRN